MTVDSTNSDCSKVEAGFPSRSRFERVVAVHKAIAPRLDFRIGTRGCFEREGPRSPSTNNRAVETDLAQLIDGLHDKARGPANRRRALLESAEMLRSPVIGLKSTEDQMRRARDPLRKRHRCRSCLQATTPRTDVNLDQNAQPPTGMGNRLLQQRNVTLVVGTDGDLGNASQSQEAGDLGVSHDLVGDKDVRNSAPGENFRFANLLDTLANRSARHLQMRDNRGFVRLCVRTQLNAC